VLSRPAGITVNPMRMLLLSSCLFFGGIANAANDPVGADIETEQQP